MTACLDIECSFLPLPHRAAVGMARTGKVQCRLACVGEKPCRWSPVLTPGVPPHRLTSFGLMMIDYGGFFITLNLISAWSNLSNDCSLLVIVKFKAFFILLHKAASQETLGNIPVPTCIFRERVGINDSQSSWMDRKSWRFCRSYITWAFLSGNSDSSP